MKRYIRSSPKSLFIIVFAVIKKPLILKSIFETFRAPSLTTTHNTTEPNLPETELLSISASPETQKGGIGSQLLTALEKELQKKGIKQYKVIAGKKLDGANKFYIKNGFVLK